jgi:hypothetical protein
MEEQILTPEEIRVNALNDSIQNLKNMIIDLQKISEVPERIAFVYSGKTITLGNLNGSDYADLKNIFITTIGEDIKKLEQKI